MAPDHGPALTEARPLSDAERAFVAEARRGTLITIGQDGWPRAVPACFVLFTAARDDPDRIYSPIDEKPKRSDDPRSLARVRDILERPIASLLVDRWDEDWTRLGWVRLSGRAVLVDPGGANHDRAVTALRAKYPQYARQNLERRPVIAIDVRRLASWGRVTPD